MEIFNPFIDVDGTGTFVCCYGNSHRITHKTIDYSLFSLAHECRLAAVLSYKPGLKMREQRHLHTCMN